MTTEQLEADLKKQHKILEERISALTTQREDIALKVAKGGSGLSAALARSAEIKVQLQAANDELEALLSAYRGLNRRKDEDVKAQRIRDLQAIGNSLPKAGEDILSKFKALDKAITAVGKAWKDLEASTDHANGLATELLHAYARPAYWQNVGIRIDSMQTLAGMLLFIAAGEKITPNSSRFGNLPATREEIFDAVIEMNRAMQAHGQRNEAQAIAAVA